MLGLLDVSVGYNPVTLGIGRQVMITMMMMIFVMVLCCLSVFDLFRDVYDHNTRL